jgi:hypothetical protein
MVEPTPSGDEVPEADLIEQHTPIEDTDVDTGTGGAGRLLPTPMAAGWEADEADQLEQAITVPLPEEDYPRAGLDR